MEGYDNSIKENIDKHRYEGVSAGRRQNTFLFYRKDLAALKRKSSFLYQESGVILNLTAA